MKVLGINAVFHDPAAAVVVDGRLVAAAEEERFTRRKHGKRPVPFSTWELPVNAASWCLTQAGLRPDDLDAVTYSYDPTLAPTPARSDDVVAEDWEGLRTLYVHRAAHFLRTALPGLDPSIVRHVPHHLCHAASAYLAAPFTTCAVITLDGRGESTSHLSGRVRDGDLEVLAETPLPHSLGLVYEELTEHLGFLRSSDEYKVMALASYGSPAHLDTFRDLVGLRPDGTVAVEPVDFSAFAKRIDRGKAEKAEADGDSQVWTAQHADLAATVQARLEEVVLDLAGWVHARTGDTAVALAGGVALNVVANTRLAEEGPFDEVWVQPAAGDAGTALGGALYLAHAHGDPVAPMGTVDLGRGWTDVEIQEALVAARVAHHRPADLADEVAAILADDGIVAWYQGRSEWGPRALGHRSLLADPRPAGNLERLNAIKGREQFRPIAPMVTAERAAEIFSGPLPSPYMLFTHRVRGPWRERIPTVVHVDGTSRIQTVDAADEPLVHRMLVAFANRTGVPVVANTSLNTAGRPIVDTPTDALECFAAAPIDALAIGPFVVRRGEFFGREVPR